MSINAYRMLTPLKQALLSLRSKRLESQRRFDWDQWARPNQRVPEGDWKAWLILAGRGYGKTRTGAETIRGWVKGGSVKRIALIGESIKEARSIMVEGESGILAISPKSERPKFESSKGRLVWPNGATATLFGGNNPEQLRGPQFDCGWMDEVAKYRDPQETWSQLMMGLRLGNDPRVILTTTPRPCPFLKSLLEDPGVRVTRGSTFENADNLAPSFIEAMKAQFEGTRLGAQELYAELLEDGVGALWVLRNLEELKVVSAPSLKRIVVSIDPATTFGEKSDETGVMVVGLGEDNHGYVLEDLSGKHSPGEWARLAVGAYHRYQADRIVAEVNKGGDLVERVIRGYDPHVSYRAVRATRGKSTRAEPIAALYEQKKIHHLKKGLDQLEAQMLSYIPGKTSKSPDRIDALVWGLTDLMLESEAAPPRVWIH